MTPRIPPLAPSDFDGEVQALLDQVRVGDAVMGEIPAANIFTTLVRHRGLFRRWLPFGGKLLAGKLPARDRELLILRTAWRCGSDYEWGQHVLLARAAGLGDDEIARLAVDASPESPERAAWSPFDAALVRAVDELHERAMVSDETWAALAERYDERQLIEVPMLVGHYHLLAFTLNSLGVEREPGVPGLPDVPDQASSR